MKYEIFDLRDGLFADRIEVEAKSPIEALNKVGYADIERTTDNSANIVVTGMRGTYLYHGKQTAKTKRIPHYAEQEKEQRECERKLEIYAELVKEGWIR